MNEFTLEELAEFNGRNNNKIYIAYNGNVYDVTGSFLWKGGKHQVTHYAGSDLSGELEKAPHGIEFLERFPVIGRIKD